MGHLDHVAQKGVLVMSATSSNSKSGTDILEMSNTIVIDSDCILNMAYILNLSCATNMLGC